MPEKLSGEPSPENIEAEIEHRLAALDDYSEFYETLGPEMEELWYWVETEARVSLDRATALVKLEEFIPILEQAVHQKKSGKSSRAGLEMYFDLKIARSFAEHEQNEKNFRVAAIMDCVIMSEVEDLPDPIYAAELGGGAHPDRYHKFFARLLKQPQGRVDWVDISPDMLKLADEYISTPKFEKRKGVIKYVQAEVLEYLEDLPQDTLDLAIMKYAIDHIKDLEKLFELLSKKLKGEGRLAASIGRLGPELKSMSTNARFLYKGEEFPEDEVRILNDGDSYTVKFFKESGNPSAGYIEGAETTKYYHSPEKIKMLAEKYGFDIFLGDWKKSLPSDKQEGETMDQDVLILRKRREK